MFVFCLFLLYIKLFYRIFFFEYVLSDCKILLEEIILIFSNQIKWYEHAGFLEITKPNLSNLFLIFIIFCPNKFLIYMKAIIIFKILSPTYTKRKTRCFSCQFFTINVINLY